MTKRKVTQMTCSKCEAPLSFEAGDPFSLLCPECRWALETKRRIERAAPDLLEALRELERECSERDDHCRPVSEDHPVRVAARAAIAKATGEG